MASWAEAVFLAGAAIQVNATSAPGERRAVGHIGWESQGFHDVPPLGTMGPHPFQAKASIHDRMRDFVSDRGREMRVPVDAKRLGIEPQNLLTIDQSPLACCAPSQIEPDRGRVGYPHPRIKSPCRACYFRLMKRLIGRGMKNRKAPAFAVIVCFGNLHYFIWNKVPVSGVLNIPITTGDSSWLRKRKASRI